MSDLIVTKLPTDTARITPTEMDTHIIHAVTSLLDDWKSARMAMELHWRECWALYFGTEYAQDWLRSRALKQSLGDVTTDWRHHITTGKAYEIVETAVPYFKNASFPNDDWFDIDPVVPIPDPNLEMFIKILKAFVKNKLDTADFPLWWEIYLRQLCITGTSCLSLPWRLETKKSKKNVLSRTVDGVILEEVDVEKVIYNHPDIAVEDMFNIWLDPDSISPKEADLIRRFTLRRGELARLVKDGVYPKATMMDIKGLKPHRRARTEERQEVDIFYGVDTTNNKSTDVIEVYEFWGCLELEDRELYDVVITWTEKTLLRVESNPYRGGKPFVIGRYTPLQESPYGWGMLAPVKGNIQELDILSNSRLDGLEITLNPTFLLRNDGTVDPQDIKSEPGRVIPVNDVEGTVRQLITDFNFSAVSVNEETTREQLVERRTGTGSFVGTSPGRDAERVTATEVEQTQSAGGNRLSGIYDNIERESLLQVIQKIYDFAQQFQSYDEIIPVQGRSSSEKLYAVVGMEQLAYDMKLRPVGARHVIQKEATLRQFTDWLAVINSNPMLMELIRWDEVALEVTRKFIEEDPERFIKKPEEMQQQQMPMAPPMPGAEMVDAAQQVGGQEFANATTANLMADGGANLMAGLNPTGATLPQSLSPEQMELINAAGTTPTTNTVGI